MLRRAAVAGQFYPGTRSGLIKEVEDCFLSKLGPGAIPEVKEGPRNIVGAVVPHAGLIYSGPVAAHAYAEIAKDGLPGTFIIIGPNHTGVGSGVAASNEDFETPMGTVKVDTDIISRLRGVVDIDRSAHFYEHSIEVQLPFIQYLTGEAKIVPIAMGYQDIDMAREVAKILREACQGKDVVYLASSDFSHYVAASKAKIEDGMVIDKIVGMDAGGVYDTVTARDVSMCGYGPVTTMMLASGGSKARLLHYGSSGDVHAMDKVVGYASIIVEK